MNRKAYMACIFNCRVENEGGNMQCTECTEYSSHSVSLLLARL